LYELRRYDEAIIQYDKALILKPDYAEAWSNKGVTLHGLEQYKEAITHYDRALSLKPDYEDAWINKAVALQELKRYPEAIAHFDKALSLDPKTNWVLGDLLQAKMQICSWSGLADSIEILSAKVMADEKVTQPFTLLALNDDPLLHKKSSETYVQAKYPLNQSLGTISKRLSSQKIRVGYFSADFRNHAVSILTAELFELHNRDRFEIIAFSFGGDDKDPMRLRLIQAFNQFIDVSDLPDMEIAKLARELLVDIAVDLGGHTARCRTGIFSYRAAPVQLSYIGYLGTMGAEYYDYLLADKITISEELQKFYSEKIAYMPCYQVNDRTRHISDKKYTRTELGLPGKGFIFCCFNNNYKILPAIFDCWMRILDAVEDSVLYIYAENLWAEENLKKEAEARGINSSRLAFGRRLPNDEYLSRYQICDLFLDTFPYNAGTTASDALWAGLPVLTLMGESFASRVAASLLNAIGLPELITKTQEEYETLAIELAKNPQKLAEIKKKLAENRLRAPLFDTPLFTKNLEAAYIAMMERYQADLQPDHIDIV
jgi:predicted O-linked N-acetylglucosamine transferase (SPINDLY family)